MGNEVYFLVASLWRSLGTPTSTALIWVQLRVGSIVGNDFQTIIIGVRGRHIVADMVVLTWKRAALTTFINPAVRGAIGESMGVFLCRITYPSCIQTAEKH